MIFRTAVSLLVIGSLSELTLVSAAPNAAQKGGSTPAPRPAATEQPAARPPEADGFAGGGLLNALSLPDINRRIALDAAALIKSKQYAQAAAVLDESDRQVREFASTSRMEL